VAILSLCFEVNQVTIQRYDHVHYGAVESDDSGQYVTYDDHEAAIRLQAARSEKIGIEQCMTELRGKCRVWGMTVEECDKYPTFGKLLAAFERNIPAGRDAILNEVASVLMLLYSFDIEDDGDGGLLRTCRDRLRKLTDGGK
jgi:hypothetical protein